MSLQPSLVGFSVLGRNGVLGVVVPPNPVDGQYVPATPELNVVGGRSSLLHLHIPLSHVSSISTETQTVAVDLDVVDFTARIADDGSVELRIP